MSAGLLAARGAVESGVGDLSAVAAPGGCVIVAAFVRSRVRFGAVGASLNPVVERRSSAQIAREAVISSSLR
jgi:hypothetical protein